MPFVGVESAPDPVGLTGLDRVLEARLGDGARRADRPGRAGVGLGGGEEHVRVRAATRGVVLPFSSYGDGVQSSHRNPFNDAGPSRIPDRAGPFSRLSLLEGQRLRPSSNVSVETRTGRSRSATALPNIVTAPITIRG